MRKNKFVLFLSLTLLVAPFLFGCDFTPRLYKEILIAQQFIQQQKYDKAIIKYEQILKQNPPAMVKIKIYYQIGELYSTYMANHPRALHYFDLIKKSTEDPLWLVKSEEKVAEINFTYLQDYRASIKSYVTLANFLPKLDKQDFYEYRLAVSYLNLGLTNKAVEMFKKISTDRTHEFNAQAYYQLGIIYFQEKKWQKAIDLWQEYTKREKRKDNIIAVKFLMANAYETMEELEKAYNLYYSILGEYPNTEVIQSRLNSIYNRKIARKR
ncbi:MAG: tetratricopeptide repeat protein [Pseudomonadota bacterium]